ncbi:biotin/lipoyl-containing protein [Candidatus Chlorohelix sp.]|uniref:biotin/lipoyl-containing protein n=1 Tax=Candidatus Chlorohelix sp. TaxID=3139201 RepID=UPI00303D91AC
MSNIFRQNALNKLSTPEDLDKTIRVTERRGWVALAGLALVLIIALVWSIFGSIPTVLRGTGLLYSPDAIKEVNTQEAGFVTNISVRSGDTVKDGQIIAKIKNQAGADIELRSPGDGTVLDVLVEKGSPLQALASVVNIELSGKPLQGVVFVSLADGKRIKPGMKVQLSPSSVRAEESGFLLGTVSLVSQFPVSSQSLLVQLKSRELVDALASGAPLIRVDVTLEKDSTFSEFKWTTGSGPHLKLTGGTLASANLVLGEQRPITLILPVFQQEGN